ncbi:Uncharacterised protein [Bordetella pertussis]|nr:Uncharacterised protein [Bordetella pertussis]
MRSRCQASHPLAQQHGGQRQEADRLHIAVQAPWLPAVQEHARAPGVAGQ